MRTLNRSIALAAGLLWAYTSSADVIKTVQAGATDQTVTFKLLDSTTGLPTAGIAYNASGMDLKYWRHGANSVVDITEATQTASGAHADGGFISLGGGVYRLDLPDAAVAAGATAVDVFGTVTGYVVTGGTVQLSPPVDVVAVSGDSAAADNMEANFDGTGYDDTSANEIDAADFAADADAEILSYIVDDATRIDASELNADIDSLTFTVAGDVDANMQGLSGDTTAADNAEAFFDGTGYCIASNGCSASGTLSGTHSSTTADLGTNAPGATSDVAGKTLVIPSKFFSRIITAYDTGTGVATFDSTSLTLANGDPWYLWETAPGAAGSGATAAEVWEYGDRQLTALDEDVTTLDFNATYVGGVSVFDEDLTTIDINGTTVGTVTTLTNLPAITAGWLTAAGIASDAFTAAKFAADVTTELQTGLATAAELAKVPKSDGTASWNATAQAAINAQVDTALADYDAPTKAELDSGLAAADDAVLAAVATAQGTIDKLDDTLEDDGGTYRFTVNALEQAPTGMGEAADTIGEAVAVKLFTYDTGQEAGDAVAGSVVAEIGSLAAGGGLTVEAIADEVQTRTIAAVTTVTNLTNAPTSGDLTATMKTSAQTAAAAALSSYDPPTRAEATSDANSVLTAIGDVPTNSELTTALAGADDAVLAAIGALNNLSDDDVRDIVIEDQGGGVSLGCAISVILAYAAGDLTTTGSSSTFEDPSGTETRNAAVVTSNGNRTSMISCPTY